MRGVATLSEFSEAVVRGLNVGHTISNSNLTLMLTIVLFNSNLLSKTLAHFSSIGMLVSLESFDILNHF